MPRAQVRTQSCTVPDDELLLPVPHFAALFLHACSHRLSTGQPVKPIPNTNRPHPRSSLASTPPKLFILFLPLTTAPPECLFHPEKQGPPGVATMRLSAHFCGPRASSRRVAPAARFA